ncbi:MAG: NAD-dependent epimerase/dehydratase family protein [Flavobacteriia bacterium]|nr:NAD-dependent epimerase/dehydratase family protein [Flavobacteriia bacterium]
MKILILGKGYVGTALAKCLSKVYEVNLVTKRELDYTDRARLFLHIQKQKDPYAFVINTCGYTGRPNVDACEDNVEDTWYYNVTVPVNIQKTCKDTGVRLIHISSGCIYDGYDKEYSEEDEPNFGLLNPKSSWYSKTKHACEMMLKDRDVYTFRIRMPFCETWSERNILTKLIKYDKIIDQKNSLTNLEDLCGFIMYFMSDVLDQGIKHAYGLYNVVNPQPIETSEIVAMLNKYGLGNKNWSKITTDELYTFTKTERSNCVLSDKKITSLELKLPNTYKSLERCVSAMRDTQDLEDN